MNAFALDDNKTETNDFFQLNLCRELQDGTIRENNLCDGAKVILIPNVETGLLVS